MKYVVATVALLIASGLSHADPQHVPFQQKKVQTRDNGKPHPFNVRDLVMLDRVSDPQFSPDGRRIAFQVRETDFAENKGVTSIWLLDLNDRSPSPEKIASTYVASSPRWSPDGKAIYFLGKPKGGKTSGVFRFNLEGNESQVPDSLTPYKVDVDNFKLSPDGKKLLLSIDIDP